MDKHLDAAYVSETNVLTSASIDASTETSVGASNLEWDCTMSSRNLSNVPIDCVHSPVGTREYMQGRSRCRIVTSTTHWFSLFVRSCDDYYSCNEDA